MARAAVTLALRVGIVAWVALLRPVSLGGSTTYVVVSGDSMLPTYYPGDLILAQASTSVGATAVGSVVVYRIPVGEPGEGRLIIHRVVDWDPGSGFTTRGDHNSYADPWHPKSGDVVGAPAAVLPGVGRIVAVVRQPIVAASFAALSTVAWLLLRRRGRPVSVRPSQLRRDARDASDVGYTPA